MIRHSCCTVHQTAFMAFSRKAQCDAIERCFYLLSLLLHLLLLLLLFNIVVAPTFVYLSIDRVRSRVVLARNNSWAGIVRILRRILQIIFFGETLPSTSTSRAMSDLWIINSTTLGDLVGNCWFRPKPPAMNRKTKYLWVNRGGVSKRALH